LKVLIPVDGSPASIRALKLAIDQLPKASFVIVNVQNPAALGLGGGGGIMPLEWIEQQEEEATRKALQGAGAVCSEAGVTCVTRSERGAIAETIDRVAREEHVTQIFMGTRGLGGVRGLVLGSVATQLLHLADVPVTLVK
jgi:nucleotide-binding universal stress UspA family protein